ncbi:hypothetical protein NDU88_004245 [Pleurodeles waltl]|uniref:Uncharacterized protein n=1 Tax=Pleurodeles waltl TaxID=8319 RepID=A0AAV7UGB8_PLEWA|nr:hypothetical protein NDU88_004245 [Pleurodeles waltl]
MLVVGVRYDVESMGFGDTEQRCHMCDEEGVAEQGSLGYSTDDFLGCGCEGGRKNVCVVPVRKKAILLRAAPGTPMLCSRVMSVFCEYRRFKPIMFVDDNWLIDCSSDLEKATSDLDHSLHKAEKRLEQVETFIAKGREQDELEERVTSLERHFMSILEKLEDNEDDPRRSQVKPTINISPDRPRDL